MAQTTYHVDIHNQVGGGSNRTPALAQSKTPASFLAVPRRSRSDGIAQYDLTLSNPHLLQTFAKILRVSLSWQCNHHALTDRMQGVLGPPAVSVSVSVRRLSLAWRIYCPRQMGLNTAIHAGNPYCAKQAHLSASDMQVSHDGAPEGSLEGSRDARDTARGFVLQRTGCNSDEARCYGPQAEVAYR